MVNCKTMSVSARKYATKLGNEVRPRVSETISKGIGICMWRAPGLNCSGKVRDHSPKKFVHIMVPGRDRISGAFKPRLP